VSETGGTWAVGLQASLPADAGPNPDVSLNSVSCAPAGYCAAAGTYEDGSGNRRGLVLSWSSGVWSTATEVAPPADANPTNANVGLFSVSCPAAGGCTAVGSYIDSSGDTQGLLVSEAGGVWGTGAKVTLPASTWANPGAILSSVSCPAAGSCSAVGAYNDGSNHRQGLLVGTSGSSSTGTEASLPPDAAPNPNVQFSPQAPVVSCASAGNCAAVGTYATVSGQDGLLLGQASGSWQPGIGAVPPGGAFGEFFSVSCAPAGYCAAVGTYDDSSHHAQGMVATRYAGTWSAATQAPLPAGARANPSVFLTSASCSSSPSCVGTGTYADSLGHTLGQLVTVKRTPSPPPPPPPPPPPRKVLPVIQSLRVSRPRIRVGRARSRRARKIQTATAFLSKLNERARVTLQFVQYANGRRKGHRCVRARRTGRRCRITYVRGLLAINARAGNNKLTFKGKIARKTLRPGRYLVLVSATDSAGNLSRTRQVRLTVVR